jgi:hypothetical protein
MIKFIHYCVSGGSSRIFFTAIWTALGVIGLIVFIRGLNALLHHAVL